MRTPSILFLFLFGMLISIAKADAPLVIEGGARAIDGRTIEIWGRKIRLWGIAAPSADTDAGRASRLRLGHLVANVTVRCERTGESSLTHMVARCYVGDIDIAWPMVMTGHAADDAASSGGYYAAPRRQ